MVTLERTRGRAQVALGPAGRLERLGQEGAAKAFLPRIHAPVPEIIFLNTAGGLTGGDRLSYAVDLAPETQAIATTQTAERAYASAGGMAEVSIGLTLGAGATLDWLPQETILFDRSALSRRLTADLGPGARLLLAEAVVIGRAAMGERVTELALTDWREVRRGGRPVFVEPLKITGPTLAAGPACLGDMRSAATLALIAEGAEDALGPVRAALQGLNGVEAAASGWDGRLVVRLMAADALPLKRALAAVVTGLGCGLPRVWQI